MSPPQKLRQRRRLRNVDNVVTVLATALSRQKNLAISVGNVASSSSSSSTSTDPIEPQSETTSDSEALSNQASRRHHKGPKRGDILPGAPSVLLSDEARRNGTIRLIERWKAEMPTEAEMLPKDKYTMFDRKAKKYRKGVHKLPKWTRGCPTSRVRNLFRDDLLLQGELHKIKSTGEKATRIREQQGDVHRKRRFHFNFRLSSRVCGYIKTYRLRAGKTKQGT
nr:54s ribosomal protein l31, mitochondrial [Quercus suber]